MSVGSLSLLLASNTAFRGWIGKKTFETDLFATVDANPELSTLDTCSRRLDVANFLDVAVDERKVQVGQRIGD